MNGSTGFETDIELAEGSAPIPTLGVAKDLPPPKPFDGKLGNAKGLGVPIPLGMDLGA